MYAFIIVLSFTFMGYHGRVLPVSDIAYPTLKMCAANLAASYYKLRNSGLPIQPDKISCVRFRIKGN